MTFKFRTAYFQGNKEDEPTPNKPKYKKEKLDQDDTKARGVFFQNYDLYDVPGPGPGAGFYQNMDKYKSVADFRKKKQKENKMKRRKALFEAIMLSTSSLQTVASDQNNLADPDKDDSLAPPMEIWSPNPPEGSPLGLNDDSYSETLYQDEPQGNLYYGIMENHNIQ